MVSIGGRTTVDFTLLSQQYEQHIKGESKKSLRVWGGAME